MSFELEKEESTGPLLDPLAYLWDAQWEAGLTDRQSKACECHLLGGCSIAIARRRVGPDIWRDMVDRAVEFAKGTLP